MEKEPWQEDIYDQEESRAERRKRTQGRDVVANRVLTILASIFFVIVVVMIIVLIYLSSGGSNRTAALKDFHDSDASVVQVSSSSSSQPEQSSEPESTSSSSEEATNPEGTIKVLAGEGEAAIAARAGISIAQLEALNPGHMATGSWFANPGDVVKIK
ncbi:SAG1386/EF1546 family surface-associated protein [Streptococcus pseudopneumoniae]|uniref:30S ribosomal protein S15 n=1 Tax=Streptococcus pseudopneumoniae TaxID=257758 RepID=A0A2N9ZX88_9STRE|nr:SAG1386/EF1546 family surface-associated protein [Streptococcus pseudopneumoniae]CEY54887.1 30S ribosomal protein S15 [Streptococcus pseudopneumoniae]CIO81866.1 30S ribosomal protein S15 [Streptococcus pseudopneumoniae]COC61248.1 30S ribosomal protein S15 [Streptococcus pseudopneumoniae]